jgi:LysM repeat protein
MSLHTCIIPCFLFIMFGLTSCSKHGTPSYNPDIGPFDEDGNYIEEWADNPPKRGTKLKRREPKPEPQPSPRIAEAPKPIYQPRPAPTARVTPAPKPKPRPVVKPKPKPKPKPVVVKPKTIRHTVQKGDTLYGLARKYGTTVSKIQKANNLSGTIIRTGKTYVIPK